MGETPVRVEHSAIRVHVWVVPGASRTETAGAHGDKLKVRVTSPPEGGRANEEVSGLLETLLGAKVELIRGMSGRHKVFEVAASDPELVSRKLGLAG